jgi:hypothetical protein
MLGKPGRQVQDIDVPHLTEIAMLKLPTALAALLLLGAPAAVHAAVGADASFKLRCEREMKPVLEVRAHEIKFNTSNTVSSRVLNTRGTYANASQMLMGMTSGSTRTEITVDGPALVDRAGTRECIAPRIAVDLAYSPMEVYVAREFNIHSCPYRAVYAHEMQHVQVYRESLPQIERHVREALAARYGERPLYAAAGDGLDQLQADVDNWLRPFIKAELARVEVLQGSLDTQEETHRLSHACLGEVATAMGSSF